MVPLFKCMVCYDVTIPARSLVEPIELYFQKIPYINRYAYGVEVAPSTGMVHYQSKVDLFLPQLPEKVSEQTYVRMLFAPFHVEKSRSDRYDYVYKEGCYFDSNHAEGLQYPWTPVQEKIIEFWNSESDDRSVCVVVDSTGSIGKTWLSRQLDNLGISVRVPQIPTDKMSGFLLDMPKYGRYVFDLTKVVGKKNTDALMSVVEELKNGCLADWRYHGRNFCYGLGQPVHVLILCNSLPRSDTLSADRWKVIYI